MDDSASELGYAVVNMTVRMVVVAVNLVGNSLILVVLKTSQNFSQVTRHLIGHVAVADIGFGCSMTIHAFLILGEAMNYSACLGITTIAIISGLCSCWGICLVFLDSYLSVRKLSPAETGLSLQKARWCMAGGWMLTAVYSLVFLLEAPKNITTSQCHMGGPAYTYGSLLSLAVLMLVVSFTAMFLMCLTLYTIKKRTDTLFQEGTHGQNVLRQRNLKRRSKIIRLFAIIAVGFIISWCPVAVAVCVALLCDDRCGITDDHIKLLSSLMALNAVMNVIVYIIKDKTFRQDATRVIMCRMNQVTPQNNTVAMVAAVNSGGTATTAISAKATTSRAFAKTESKNMNSATTSTFPTVAASATAATFATIPGTVVHTWLLLSLNSPQTSANSFWRQLALHAVNFDRSTLPLVISSSDINV